MGIGSDLLRLLEPTVRPGGLPGPSRRGGAAPIETQSFESLLENAQASASSDDPSAQAVSTPPAGNRIAPLGSLAQIDRIENESLRMLRAGSGVAASTNSIPSIQE